MFLHACRIEARTSQMEVELVHEMPCLVNEFYHVQIKLKNLEESQITSVRWVLNNWWIIIMIMIIDVDYNGDWWLMYNFWANPIALMFWLHTLYQTITIFLFYLLVSSRMRLDLGEGFVIYDCNTYLGIDQGLSQDPYSQSFGQVVSWKPFWTGKYFLKNF